MASPNLRIESPGVQITEIDGPITINPRTGTDIYLPGFTSNGPTNEPVKINTIQEYEELFGLPQTAAESYTYHAARQVLNTDAQLTVCRMPYGSGCGYDTADYYSALVYPVVGVSAVEVTPCAYFQSLSTTALVNAAVAEFPDLQKFLTFNVWESSFNANVKCPSVDFTNSTPFVSAIKFSYNATCSGYLTKFKFPGQTLANITAANAGFSVPHLQVGNTDYIFAGNDDGSFVPDDDFQKIPISVGINNITFYVASGSAKLDLDNFFDFLPIQDTSVYSGYSLSSFAVSSMNSANLWDVPVEAFFEIGSACRSCELVESLGLKVPEKYRWNFYPIAGDCQLNDPDFYVFGEPIHKIVSETELELLENQQFDWKCGCFANTEANLDLVGNDVRAGLIIVNKLKTAVLDDYQGFYVAVNDNLNVNPATDFDNITGVAGKYSHSECVGLALSGTWTPVPSERWNFDVSQPFNGKAGSIAEIIEQSQGWEFSDDKYKDSLSVSLFKIRPTRFGDDAVKLDQILVEKFIGSLNSERKVGDPSGGPDRTFYLEEVVNRGSNYLKAWVNPYIAENNCWTGGDGKPSKYVRMFRKRTQHFFNNFNAGQSLRNYADKLYALGVQKSVCVDRRYELCKRKDIGLLPCKLDRALKALTFGNIDIDITVDNGLSTIWATREAVTQNTCITDKNICYHYDDGVYVDTSSLMPYDGNPISSALQDGWEEVYNVFNDYVLSKIALGNPGHLHIQDPLRQIFVNGKDYKTIRKQQSVTLDANGQVTDRYSTFSRMIYTPLRNLFQGVNSSYVTTYANWVKDYIPATDKKLWFPFSAYAASGFANVDRFAWPWTPYFGVNRGIVPDVLDIAINPNNQRERDFLYRINFNPVYLDNDYGYVVFGEKTMLRADKATSRNGVRRGLLFLEKVTQRYLKQFVGEPNTLSTRLRIKNGLDPLFDTAVKNEGLYGYAIICDERNNTPTDIDNRIVNVTILVQPVRGIEFVNALFQVEKTGVNLKSGFNL